jgi:hypothetical protein
MNRNAFHLSFVAVLLSCSAALAQVGSGQPPPPPSAEAAPPPGPAVPPPAAQPEYPQPAPYGPVPGQPIYSQPAPYGPVPGQPLYPQPAPYMLVPGQPIYPQPAPWMPPPSPGLGLVPGDTNAHWDISVDSLWLERETGKGIPLGYASYNLPHGFQGGQTDSMWSDDVLFPLEPGIRLQLVGRITDQTAIEATYWGLQQWSIGETIYGEPVGETIITHSPWLALANFDNSLGYTYTSQVNNVEINQRFKLFSFDPSRAFTWLWGVRYFRLSDNFTLSGSNLNPVYDENLNWQTQNNLIGMQLGLQWVWGWNRFQLSTELKIGLFANAYSQQGTDSASGAIGGFQAFDGSHSGTDLASLLEFSVLLRYRLTPNMWLRAGYQYYGVTGLALGPQQLAGYDAGSNIGLDGVSLGLELTR